MYVVQTPHRGWFVSGFPATASQYVGCVVRVPLSATALSIWYF